jgi:hypothetical protein
MTVLHSSINCQRLTTFVALFLSELGLLVPDTEENSILTRLMVGGNHVEYLALDH